MFSTSIIIPYHLASLWKPKIVKKNIECASVIATITRSPPVMSNDPSVLFLFCFVFINLSLASTFFHLRTHVLNNKVTQQDWRGKKTANLV